MNELSVWPTYHDQGTTTPSSRNEKLNPPLSEKKKLLMPFLPSKELSSQLNLLKMDGKKSKKLISRLDQEADSYTCVEQKKVGSLGKEKAICELTRSACTICSQLFLFFFFSMYGLTSLTGMDCYWVDRSRETKTHEWNVRMPYTSSLTWSENVVFYSI